VAIEKLALVHPTQGFLLRHAGSLRRSQSCRLSQSVRCRLDDLGLTAEIAFSGRRMIHGKRFVLMESSAQI
jgi:hypothetical protein